MAKVFVGADVIKGYIGIESGGGENKGTGKMSIQQQQKCKKVERTSVDRREYSVDL